MKLDLSKSWQQETVAAMLHLRDSAHLIQILDYCITLELFDKQLWASDRIIFSHGLYNRYLSRLEERLYRLLIGF